VRKKAACDFSFARSQPHPVRAAQVRREVASAKNGGRLAVADLAKSDEALSSGVRFTARAGALH